MANVSCIVFAGGLGTRLGGTKKALLDVGGQPIIERVLDTLRPLGDEIVIVDNDDSLAGLPGVRVVPDTQTRAGVLVALSSGLAAAKHELCVVVACDMPFLDGRVLGWLVDLADGYDVVIPVSEGQMDPMHAVYRREPCLAAIQAALARNEKRMIAYLQDVRVREVSDAELRAWDPELRSLFNVNTPEDLARARTMASLDGSV